MTLWCGVCSSSAAGAQTTNESSTWDPYGWLSFLRSLVGHARVDLYPKTRTQFVQVIFFFCRRKHSDVIFSAQHWQYFHSQARHWTVFNPPNSTYITLFLSWSQIHPKWPILYIAASYTHWATTLTNSATKSRRCCCCCCSVRHRRRVAPQREEMNAGAALGAAEK